MATSDYGQVYYPPGTGVSPSVPTAMSTMAESLEGRTVMSFTDVASRDSAVATLTTAQKKGVVCHVQTGSSAGWWGYSGSTWYRFSMLGITHNRGTAQGTCDSNGIMSVNHGLPAAPVSVMVTMEGDASQIKYLKPAVVLIDSTRVLVKFWYSDPSGNSSPIVNAGAYTSFHWRAEL
jgi:hypothetical protein